MEVLLAAAATQSLPAASSHRDGVGSALVRLGWDTVQAGLSCCGVREGADWIQANQVCHVYQLNSDLLR